MVKMGTCPIVFALNMSMQRYPNTPPHTYFLVCSHMVFELQSSTCLMRPPKPQTTGFTGDLQLLWYLVLFAWVNLCCIKSNIILMFSFEFSPNSGLQWVHLMWLSVVCQKKNCQYMMMSQVFCLTEKKKTATHLTHMSLLLHKALF